ncbi:MAG: hypothetical protein WC979_02560 [Candidatus Pacearchaeota archaeon]|jgi:predicted transcriptional regulator|nr:hypothetical protein [Clostridia bacterium]
MNDKQVSIIYTKLIKEKIFHELPIIENISEEDIILALQKMVHLGLAVCNEKNEWEITEKGKTIYEVMF